MNRLGRPALAVLCAATVIATLTIPLSTPPAVAAASSALPTQAMEGNLKIGPGSSLRAGFSFAMTGHHPAATVSFQGAVVTFAATCASGQGGGTITVPVDAGSPYQVSADDGHWLPSGDQSSPLTFQGSVPVPDLCHGGLVSLAHGGSFATGLQSSDTADPVQVHWHYSAGGSAGGWSGTTRIVPGAVPPGTPPSASGAQIIVKVDRSNGGSIGSVVASFPVTVIDGGLASRGIYLLAPTGADAQQDPNKLSELAHRIAGSDEVLWAEPNFAVQLADDREFYGWPYGSPTPAGNLPEVYTNQPAAAELRLSDAHGLSDGSGVLVAVLDTGVDPSAPALAGREVSGWNYVDDDSQTDDVASGRDDDGDGVPDSAVGHGTFVAGIVSLVAPGARLLVDKVLDSDGYGTTYGAAEAISDATAAGAKVINLSFGTRQDLRSHLLRDAIHHARSAGVIVVAAAGNDGNNLPHQPASQAETLSVGALGAGGGSMASFSDFGDWVDVAAPGEKVVGPVPGGGYATWAGTSMAAPFVTGQVSLIQAAVPGIKPDKVIDAIAHTSTRLPNHVVKSGTINVPASIDYATTHR